MRLLVWMVLLVLLSLSPQSPWVINTVLVMLMLVLFIGSRLNRALSAAFLVTGLVIPLWSLQYQTSRAIWPQAQLEGTRVITGTIASIVDCNSMRCQCDLKVTPNAGDPVLRRGGLIRVAWYKPLPDPIPLPGETWSLALKFKEPRNLHNPGAFNWRRHLQTLGVNAVSTVDKHGDNRRLSSTSPWHSLDYCRYRIITYLESHYAFESIPTMLALGLGHKATLANDKKMTLLKTGTSHLFAISGLHVGLLSYFVYHAVIQFWRRSHRLAMRVPQHAVASIAAMGVAATYAYLSGFSVSVQRSLIMIIVVLLAKMLNVFMTTWQALLMAFALILVATPYSVYSMAFVLSFSAVACIVIIARFYPALSTPKCNSGYNVNKN